MIAGHGAPRIGAEAGAKKHHYTYAYAYGNGCNPYGYYNPFGYRRVSLVWSGIFRTARRVRPSFLKLLDCSIAVLGS